MSPDDRVRLRHMVDAIDAALRFSKGRSRTPDIPWAAISGMRNRLIHAYFDVDIDMVWATLSQALPVLRGQLQAVLVET